jgi:hypothetical protein
MCGNEIYNFTYCTKCGEPKEPDYFEGEIKYIDLSHRQLSKEEIRHLYNLSEGKFVKQEDRNHDE